MEELKELRNLLLKDHIKALDDLISREMSAEELEKLLIELENLTIISENHLRVQIRQSELRRVQYEKDSVVGKHFEDFKKNFDKEKLKKDIYIAFRSWEASYLLCELMHKEMPDIPLPKLAADDALMAPCSQGAIRVVWDPTLLWIVRSSAVMWPAVDVRVYSTDYNDESSIQTFRLATSLIKHAKEHLCESPKK